MTLVLVLDMFGQVKQVTDISTADTCAAQITPHIDESEVWLIT